jgi:hypothetical protein
MAAMYFLLKEFCFSAMLLQVEPVASEKGSTVKYF